MPATYESIATHTISGSSTASYTFSNIPGTYTDLVIAINNIGPSTNSIGIRFNSDTGANYSDTILQGDTSSASSQRDTNASLIYIAGISTSPNIAVVNVMNYSATTTYKSVLSRANWGGHTLIRLIVGLWQNTAAITSLTIFTVNATNFTAGDTLTIYGIKAA